jgi:hypothetical protein
MNEEHADARVFETVKALEAADGPLRPREWPALDDPMLRELVREHLRALGRELILVTYGDGGPTEGWVSGWSDAAAQQLSGEAADLETADLAVLALIYLHTEILEHSLGEEGMPVLAKLESHRGRDGRDTVKGDRLKESIRRLRAHQLITSQYAPGPALRRLTPAQRKRLEGNLVILLRPGSLWARDIRAARNDESDTGAAG